MCKEMSQCVCLKRNKKKKVASGPTKEVKMWTFDVDMYAHTVDVKIEVIRIKDVCVDGGDSCNVMPTYVYD